MKLKNKFIKRFSAVFCACMIACLSFLAVIGFSPKTEKISASADEETDIEFEYFLSVGSTNPNATVLRLYSNSNYYPINFCSFVIPLFDSYLITVPRYAYYSNFDNTRDIFSYWFISRTGLPTYVIDFPVSSDSSKYNGNPIRLSSVCKELCDTIPFDNNGEYVISLAGNSISLSNSYFWSNTYVTTFSDDSSLILTVTRSLSGGASQEELDQAFNNGYMQGEIAGKIEGVQQGVDQVSVNTASKNIFESSAVRNLVDVSTGQSTDIQLSFEPFKLSYYPDTPIYRLYSPNTSSFPDGIYRVTIAFSPYINYTKDDEVPIDELKISTDYVVENSFNDFSFISDIRGTVGDISSTVTAYDMQIVDSNYVYSVDSLGDYKAFSFGSTDIADTPYLEVLSFNIDTSKISGNTIAYFSTEELMSAYNGAYKDGNILGETVGYNKGVEAAHTYTFFNLITSVIDAPIKSFMGLLDFEILGTNMSGFFLSLLSVALVIACYRFFKG